MLAPRRAGNKAGLKEKKAPGQSGWAQQIQLLQQQKVKQWRGEGQPFSSLCPVVMDTEIFIRKGVKGFLYALKKRCLFICLAPILSLG